VHLVDRERKRELLAHLIKTGVIDQALVFTRTKHGANRLAQQLERDGIGAAAIHGNRSQGQRVRALADFKAGRTPILVATEIAARGLDIDQLPHVVNFELPMVPADYVHRIGRTGRAGSTGLAVSLVCVDEHKLLREIEIILGKPIPQEVIASFEPDRSIRPEPILRGGLGTARPQGQRGGGRGPAPVRGGTPFRGGEARPVHRSPDRPIERQGERPAQGRPAQGRPAQGRPGQARPAQRPATLRPGQSLGQRPAPAHPSRNGGRPGDRPAAYGSPRPVERHPGHAGPAPRPVNGQRPTPQGGRPVAMPGERIARVNDRG
jgi:ATP-dependent RNA helicase RhlE